METINYLDGVLARQIKEVIKETVNGKIDGISKKIDEHNVAHEADMRRIVPVLEAYESAQNAGRLAMKAITVMTAIGGAWMAVKQIWPS